MCAAYALVEFLFSVHKYASYVSDHLQWQPVVQITIMPTEWRART